MGTLTLLGLLAIAFGISAFDSSDADTPVEEPDLPVDPDPEPESEPDLGATFAVEGDTITIEVGEDETGDLVAVRTETAGRFDSDDNGTQDGTRTNYGLRVYLVPQGVTFPPDVDSVIANLPPDQQDAALQGFEAAALPIEVYLANIGAQEIGRVDLGAVSQTQLNGLENITDTRVLGTELVANRAITTYEIEGNLQSFRADPLDNSVAGNPLIEIPQEDLFAPDITPEDGAVTFADGVVTLTVADGAGGELIAVRTITEFIGSPSCCNGGFDHSLEFYLLPEDTDFPPSFEQMYERAPLNSEIREEVGQFVNDGEQAIVDYHQALDAIGAVRIAVQNLGRIGTLGSDGDDPGTSFDTVVRDYDIQSNRSFTEYELTLGPSETISSRA